RNIGTEFLTVLSTYLEPRAFAADNAWPLRMLGHSLDFSFLMTPLSSTQANMWRGRTPCIARHESSWTSSSLSCDARPGNTRPPDQRAAGLGESGRTSALPREFRSRATATPPPQASALRPSRRFPRASPPRGHLRESGGPGERAPS